MADMGGKDVGMEINQHSVPSVLTSKKSKKVRSFYISERTFLTSTINNLIDDIASILLTTAREKREAFSPPAKKTRVTTSRTIISAAWLRLLPGVHLLPIDQMFFLGS